MDSILQDINIKSLKQLLVELQEMQPLPPICSEQYFKDIKIYYSQREAIADKMRHAEVVALMSLPDEVKAVFEPIRQRYDVLIGLKGDD